MAKHKILSDRVTVYRRGHSRFWQCSTTYEGQFHRKTTKESSLDRAKEFAEGWYFDLRAGLQVGKQKTKTFAQAFKVFKKDFQAITSQRNAEYVKYTIHRIEKFVMPFMGDDEVLEITPARVQEYRHFRRAEFINKHGREIARSTLDKDIIAIGQVLKTAVMLGWLLHVPVFSEPYRKNSKISHRPWFSKSAYRSLCEAIRRRAFNPMLEKYNYTYHQLYDFVIFMANTGLRPDEAKHLRYSDVKIIEDEGTQQIILLIEVHRGKRGFGYCKSTMDAVAPFERLIQRNEPNENDLIFPRCYREVFNKVLEAEGLKFDEIGKRRTFYSLRHSYICFRLLDGADIYQLAKNCRTSVEMIEKYYATHIENSLDAAAFNVMRPRSRLTATYPLTHQMMPEDR